MELLRTRADLRSALSSQRRLGASIGLVPTMGALHRGHLSLIERAALDCDRVAVSIFVNPIQFGSPEDLERYPRDLDADVALAAGSGADFVFAPTVEEMYPNGESPTTVEAGPVAGRLEGAARPGHFRGVATVVTKLVCLAGPCRAYFGEKDFQQLVVVRQVARDLDLPAEVVGCGTVREADGLAMSSRNRRLGAHERAAAPVLYRALVAGRDEVTAGAKDPEAVASAMERVVGCEPLAQLDYAEVRDPDTLAAMRTVSGEARLLVAAELGGVRLIDNLGVTS